MPRIAVTSTVHFLPGKREQYLQYLNRADAVRRKWGMLDSIIMEKVVDPRVLVLVEIWESEERYEGWRTSPARSKVMAEGRQWRVREPGLRYRVLDPEKAG